MGLNYKVPNIHLVDTTLRDDSVPGIRLSNVRWSVDTAGPSPCNNLRTEIFFEGCKKAIEGNPCNGCFNKSTWIYGKNPLQDPRKVAKHIANNSNGYVTIGGGDPLDQIDGLILLTKELKKYNVNIIVYTWRKFVEMAQNNSQGVLPIGKTYNYNISEDINELSKYVNFIIDGEFIEDKKILNFNSDKAKNKFVGSSNQRIWDIKNKKNYSLEAIREIGMNSNGELIIEK